MVAATGSLSHTMIHIPVDEVIRTAVAERLTGDVQPYDWDCQDDNEEGSVWGDGYGFGMLDDSGRGYKGGAGWGDGCAMGWGDHALYASSGEGCEDDWPTDPTDFEVLP